jgi:hypothetical protein
MKNIIFRFYDAIQSDRRLLTFRRKVLPLSSGFINRPENKQSLKSYSIRSFETSIKVCQTTRRRIAEESALQFEIFWELCTEIQLSDMQFFYASGSQAAGRGAVPEGTWGYEKKNKFVM